MEYIAHRINTISGLKATPEQYGIELDLRDSGKRLVLEHDPFLGAGEDFAEYLKHYRHGTLILNIKSERIEEEVLRLVKKFCIKNYFLLDSSYPMVVSLAKQGERNIALRFSEYEKLDSILSLEGKVNWVWVDCFDKLPIDQKSYKILKKAGFKLCLVSPDLQGRPQDIEPYKKFLNEKKIAFDAICAKAQNLPLWSRKDQ